MTLLGKDVAVVSLGLSCQTALQLRAQAALIAEIVDDPLEYHSCFFNWMLSDIRALIAFVRAHVEALSASDFVPNLHCLKLRDHDLWLWDEPPELTPELAASKYTHHLQQLWSAGQRSVRYFVVSNTQNNLIRTPWIDFELTDARAADLQSALDASFPNGVNKLIVVTHHNRSKPSAGIVLAPDDSDWEGSQEAWSEVYRTAFARY